jgi:tetratricopeptide (TPR) repeat protein
MDPNGISLLKEEVEKVFGRRILSSADCQNLCSEILRTSSVKISFNTIRRFCNLMKGTQPTVYTLNALSNYCGFTSFDEFTGSKQQVVAKEQHKPDQVLLSFLTLFFKQIEVCKKDDITYLNFVQQTILHLKHYPSVIDRFQREIAKTKNGQSFYFEQFVFIDKLNSYYGTGLQYYLNEKKTKEAQLFGHSLLCYHSWLTKNNEGVEKHYEKIMQYDIDKSTTPSINARYFAAQLFYADVLGLDEQAIILKVRKFYLSVMQLNDHNSCINCFEIILAEALILTSKYEEALFYIEEVLRKIKRNIPSYIDVALYENICLLKAIVFAQTGKKGKAYEILQDINPYKFSFLSRQYLNILYLTNKQIIKNKPEEQKQIQHLIQETGFVRLLSVWQKTSVLDLNS